MNGEKLAKLTAAGFVFNVKAAKAAAASVAAAGGGGSSVNNNAGFGVEGGNMPLAPATHQQQGTNQKARGRKRNQPQPQRRLPTKVSRYNENVDALTAVAAAAGGLMQGDGENESASEDDEGVRETQDLGPGEDPPLAIDHYHHQQQPLHRQMGLPNPPPGISYQNHGYQASPHPQAAMGGSSTAAGPPQPAAAPWDRFNTTAGHGI